MNVSQAIFTYLKSRGIDTAFAVDGAAAAGLIHGANASGLRLVYMLHEQAAGFAAEAWAKITGKPGLVIATSGPGGQNLVTPLANCWYDSTPLFVITGQVHSKFLNYEGYGSRQRGFQEWPATEIIRPLTKDALPLHHKDYLWKTAWLLAASTGGRKGPVWLDVPQDVQREEVDEKLYQRLLTWDRLWTK